MKWTCNRAGKATLGVDCDVRTYLQHALKRDILDRRKDVEEGMDVDGSGQAEMENITDRL